MLYIAISKSVSLFASMAGCCQHQTQTSYSSCYFATQTKDKAKSKAKTKRKFWIFALNVERFLLGAYNSTFLLARENDRYAFFKYTRLSPERFNHPLSLIRPKIEKSTKFVRQYQHRSDLLQHFGTQLAAIQSNQSVINIKWGNLL